MNYIVKCCLMLSVFVCLSVKNSYGVWRAVSRARTAALNSLHMPARVPNFTKSASHFVPIRQNVNMAMQKVPQSQYKTIKPQQIFKQQSGKSSSYSNNNEHCKRASRLMGTGIALAVLNDESEKKKTTEPGRPAVLLVKKDVLAYGKQLKKEFIECARGHITTQKEEVIEAIVTIIELWPDEIASIENKVLELAQKNEVHAKIIAALEKIKPGFNARYVYVQDCYNAAFKAYANSLAVSKAQPSLAQPAITSDANDSIISGKNFEKYVWDPAVSHVLWSVPMNLLTTPYNHINYGGGWDKANKEWIPGDPEKFPQAMVKAFKDSPSVLVESVRTIPDAIVKSSVNGKLVEGTHYLLDQAGLTCPDYNEKDTNFTRYACLACRNFIIPMALSAHITTPVVEKVKSEAGISLTLWEK